MSQHVERQGNKHMGIRGISEGVILEVDPPGPAIKTDAMRMRHKLSIQILSHVHKNISKIK